MQRIRDAQLPQDAGSFGLEELEAAGVLRQFQGQIDGQHKRLFVLFAVQARELRKQRDGLQRKIDLSKNYFSPVWEKVWQEPCPLKQSELRRKAEAEDARGNAKRVKERDASSLLMTLLGRKGSPKWLHRDERQIGPWFHPSLWHEPMSVMEYRDATGMTRRTVQNVLRRLSAKPVVQRKRPNEPHRYDLSTNHAVRHCYWLTKDVKDTHKRRGWLARTLVECREKTPQHFDQLFESVRPVLDSIEVQSEAQVQKFMTYLDACQEKLYPPIPLLGPADQLSQFGGLSGIMKLLK